MANVNIGTWGIDVRSERTVKVTDKKLDLFLRLMEDENEIDIAIGMLQGAAARCATRAGIEIVATSL